MNQLRRRRPEAALSNTFYALVDIQLVKEIQCLVSVASLEVLCAAQKVERRADIECELFQLYHCRGTVGRGHGDNDESTSKKEALDMSLSNDSTVAKFFEGRDQFAAATTVEWIHNDGNSNNTKLKRRCLAPGLVQKLQCTGTGIVLDNTFTTASHEKTLPLFLLRSKSFYKHKSAATMTTKDLISGSIVYNLANQAIAMCREAVHMGADFLINGQLPENQTRHDYFQHVLNKMYQTYGPGQSKSAPEGWYFKGWMAFYLFGPMAEPAHQCRLIMSRVPLLSPLPASWIERFRLPVAALPPTNKPSTAATVKSAERGVHGNALNEGLEACHGTSKATTGSAEDAMHQIASIGMETARTTWPHDKIQPAYRDADHSSTLESFQRVAQRVHDETSLMLSTMHAKLVELEGLQENGAGTNTNKTAVGLKTKKRAELHVFCREQQTKRQRLFSEYDSVLSMLIEQGSSTTTTTVTDCHQAPTSSSSARVSMSPSHPAATSENQDDVEIFGC